MCTPSATTLWSRPVRRRNLPDWQMDSRTVCWAIISNIECGRIFYSTSIRQQEDNRITGIPSYMMWDKELLTLARSNLRTTEVSISDRSKAIWGGSKGRIKGADQRGRCLFSTQTGKAGLSGA